jgi:hypothetical protein
LAGEIVEYFYILADVEIRVLELRQNKRGLTQIDSMVGDLEYLLQLFGGSDHDFGASHIPHAGHEGASCLR